MGLLDLRTNLKSLRYGKDRVGGGSSNQPYIQRDLPDSLSEVGKKGGPDFLLRGGTLVPGRVANDVSRLTQMFFDFKSPNGLLFAVKQNVLASSAVNPKAGFETYEKKKLDDSLSGLKKVANQISTTFKNNIGLDKSNIYTPLGTIAQSGAGVIGAHLNKQGLNPFEGNDTLGYSSHTGLGLNNKASRNKILLTNGKLTSKDNFLYEYVGGPGANLGVGRTKVERFINSPSEQKQTYDKTGGNSKTLSYSTLTALSDDTRDNRGKIIDFRQSEGGSKVKSLDYRTKNIETRVNLGNPGKSPVTGSDGFGVALDKINAFAMYKSDWAKTVHEKNDLVKFRIGIFDNDNPTKKTYLHFRAFIDQYSDSYSAEWNSEKFLGRGENFYRYNGFGRTINLGWTVAAQSEGELIPQYQKLNYLASSLAPNYSKDTGYMRGNLAELTVGGWLFNQPGIIQSMTLDVPQESPWEIGISTSEDQNSLNVGQEKVKSSAKLKELPHIVKVTGFTFIPIHKFVPQVQNNIFDGDKGYLSKFGKEQYIALDAGGDPEKGTATNNYTIKDLNYIGKNNY